MALITATARLNVSAKTPATVCPRAARQLARGAHIVRRAGSEDEAKDSSAYRSEEKPELGGFIGKLVESLPDGRKETAPESYGSRPESKTLKEGRYARGDPIRSGQVREDTIRGEDFEVVESSGPSVTTLVTLAVGAAVLFGVYKVVDLLQEAPVEKRATSARMPATDKPAPAPKVAETSSTITTDAALTAPEPAA